jgi:nucleoside-diphosphate-sugar epimerase
MAKLAACWAALGVARGIGITGTWVRIFSIYGEGDRDDALLPHLFRCFIDDTTPRLTQCEQQWDFLHVDDAVSAFLKLAEKDGQGIFNLGSGKAVSLRSVVEAVAIIAGSYLDPEFGALDYRPDQVMHLEADITRLQSLMGWEPTVMLDEGLKRLHRALTQSAH